jgi:hypothetical protein
VGTSPPQSSQCTSCFQTPAGLEYLITADLATAPTCISLGSCTANTNNSGHFGNQANLANFTCNRCDVKCLTCDPSVGTTCTSCNVTSTYKYLTAAAPATCSDTCPDGQFANTTSGLCEVCPPLMACTKCSMASGSIRCTACAAGQGIVVNGDYSCKICTAAPLTNHYLTSLIPNTCAPCDPTCNGCAINSTSCLAC